MTTIRVLNSASAEDIDTVSFDETMFPHFTVSEDQEVWDFQLPIGFWDVATIHPRPLSQNNCDDINFH